MIYNRQTYNPITWNQHLKLKISFLIIFREVACPSRMPYEKAKRFLGIFGNLPCISNILSMYLKKIGNQLQK